MSKKLYIILLSWLAVGSLAAQTVPLSNLRATTLPPDTLLQRVLDTLTVVPESVMVYGSDGQLLPPTAWRVADNALIWTQAPTDTIYIRYRVLPFDLGAVRTHLDTAQLLQDISEGPMGLRYDPYAKEAELIDFKGLDYNGSFSRGLSFGNNQDVVLNSSFNLQLAGQLGDGIEVQAAITDENIPLQAEGDTRQLREFDRIFVQLKKGNTRLIAGDYELPRPKGYFLNYFKKLQGGTFGTEQRLGEQSLLRASASAAISRGKFARNQIAQQEGNQGPYKLRGAQGERFIIVLSGTEKIYLDGFLLQRGIEDDYVIDYNQGELTFTEKRLITKDSRIIAEFEYADQRYVRSLYALNTEYERGKLRLHYNLYNEQDSRNTTGDQRLSEAEQRVLADAGNNPALAVVPAIDTVGARRELRATYQLVDTLLACGGATSLLRYDSAPETGLYVATFSFVGQGQGDYVLDPALVANERAYRWVPPDAETCARQGDHAPVRQLIAPKQQRMMTLGGAYELSATAGLRAEVALSTNDQNRFSERDNADNDGLAAFVGAHKRWRLGRDSSGWSLHTKLDAEWVQQTFTALNPYRNQEFLRDWNLANIQGIGDALNQAEEQVLRGELRVDKAGWGALGYEWSSFVRQGSYEGRRHLATLRGARAGWLIDGQASLVETQDRGRSTRFLRPNLRLEKAFPKLGGWRLGLFAEQEKSDRFAAGSGLLEQSSFFFDRYRLLAETAPEKPLSLSVNYTQRRDYAPQDADFVQNALAREMNLNGQWRWRRALQAGGTFTYRQLDIVNTALTPEVPAETYLGRVDMALTLLKGAVRSNTIYQIGSGQEPRVAFTYLEVTPGSGTHIWLDSLYNNDGAIQPNEMEIAPFPDQANYIRVSIFTDDFIRTNNTGLNQNLQLTPKAVWHKASGWRKLAARFSTQSTMNIDRKTRQVEGVQAWNPLQLDLPDTALVALSSNVRHTLFFNRADPKYDVQLGQARTRSRNVLTTGYESRLLAEQFVRLRWNVTRSIGTQVELKQGRRESDSEFFNNKDFRLDFIAVAPQLTILPSKDFRTIITYRYQRDRNTLPGAAEKAGLHEVSAETTFNRSAKSSLRSRLSFIDIQFDGEPNSPVGFAILNGLRSGRNYLWNLGLNRQLSRNIQLNLTYEGRKTGDNKMIHTGRAQVTAVF